MRRTTIGEDVRTGFAGRGRDTGIGVRDSGFAD
jgi:hypothetical protein